VYPDNPAAGGDAGGGAGQPSEWFHWALLGLSSGVILLSLVLRVSGRESVVAPLLNRPLPQVCTLKRLAGVDCPGCGLTRSFICLAHGDVRGGWRHNPAGFLFFALVLFQAPYRIAQIWRRRRGLSDFRLAPWDTWYLWLLAIALVAQWLVSAAIRALAR
jgi:hypothetical protein